MWSIAATMTLLASSNNSNNSPLITGLYRHAVKGLSADVLDKVTFETVGETFPDDRRFALLQEKKNIDFDPNAPEWLHKENFLCAFTAPELMSTFLSSYEIVESSDGQGAVQRLLTINDRTSNEHLLGPIDLATESGRDALATFISEKSGSKVSCVASNKDGDKHTHQFGNTSSGMKARGDTRTVHIVNSETVKCLSDRIGFPLNPTRFRPNVVLEGMDAWGEFDLVGKQITIGTTKLSVVKQTVRCEGISIDPLDPENVLEIPKILTKEFPEYGPFFGVYAVVDEPGTIQIGDSVAVVPDGDNK